MGTFQSELRVQFVDGDRWVLTSPLTYVSSKYDAFIVPAGFSTDFASIPRVLWTAVGHPSGLWGPAAVLHDHEYAAGKVTRAEADWLFRDAMEALGVSRARRWTLYLGVRSGGWLAWRRHRSRDTSESLLPVDT
jgi:hypothetical protein